MASSRWPITQPVRSRLCSRRRACSLTGVGAGVLWWRWKKPKKKPGGGAAPAPAPAAPPLIAAPTPAAGAPAPASSAAPAPPPPAPVADAPWLSFPCALKLDGAGLTVNGDRVDVPTAVARCKDAGRAELVIAGNAPAAIHAQLAHGLFSAGVPLTTRAA